MWTVMIAIAVAEPPADPAQLGHGCHEAAKAQPVPDGATSIGAFSQVRATGEHAYGYAIELIRHGEHCSGLLLRYAGEVEPHWSVLRPITCADDGRITFETRGEWWLAYSDKGPFAHRVTFEGTLKDGRLQGRLQPPAGEPLVFNATADEVPLAMRWETISTLRDADACVDEGIRER